MATAKKAEETRLTHRNGATVVVTPEKAERLLAGTLWSAPKRTTAKADDAA